MLVTLRDQDLPLPAGAILISPWVDLTHSFPSVAGVNPMDYIPPHGFQQRPSISWPPPNSDEMLAITKGAARDPTPAATETTTPGTAAPTANTNTGPDSSLSVMIDGKLVEIK